MNRSHTLAAVLLALGCSTALAVSSVAKDDELFLQRAAADSLFQREASKLAVERSDDKRLRSLASALIDEQNDMRKKLKYLGKRKNVGIPSELDEKDERSLRDLQSASDGQFDEAYLEAMDEGHDEIETLFKQAHNSSKDADIRSFVMLTLPKIQAHDDRVEALHARLD